MSASGLQLRGDLCFEHIGSMSCAESLLLCDIEYFDPRFAGMRRGQVSLSVEVEVEPGPWQVLLVREPAGEDGELGELRFVLLAHDTQLEDSSPLDEAEAIAQLRIDSGRITVVDVELREDEVIATALVEAPREQVPCMLTAPDDNVARGALVDIDLGGVFSLFASSGTPRSALFLALAQD